MSTNNDVRNEKQTNKQTNGSFGSKNRSFRFGKKSRNVFNKNNELSKKDRIAKRLAMHGVASRREAEKMVLEGKVKINGIVCEDLSFLVGYEDQICVNKKEIINKPVQTKIFILNKPAGCVTTSNDPQGRRTIFDLIPEKFGRLITVGRLDYNTEGLLLLTNNGELARVMEMPSTGLKRVYYAGVVGDINDKMKEKLSGLKNGIKIKGIEYGKMIVEVENYSQTRATLKIIIFEGKNNEIRQIMWHLGLKVVKLKRVQYGDFRLQGLPSGCVQESRVRVDIRALERQASKNIKKYKEKQKNTQNNVAVDKKNGSDVIKTNDVKHNEETNEQKNKNTTQIESNNVKQTELTDDCGYFVEKDSVEFFKKIGANDKIISLWLEQKDNISQILQSTMVQGMKNGSLVKQDFDNLYMKPDVIYIYNLGVLLKRRAEMENNVDDKNNLSMIADMFMSYENEQHCFEKYNLDKNDILDDEVCKTHTDLFANKLSINEYYVAILTDMMPYVCFSYYLNKNIMSSDNIWKEYAQKYGTENCDYVSNKLSKSIQIANKVLDDGLVSHERAGQLFADGIEFEKYFIIEAMKGELVKKIKKITQNNAGGDL